VGFHPELTGRENVYVNATILGLTRSEIDAKYDEIVAFSEIANFMETPVKFYSSGMYVRLGFSVAVLVEPDVLLVDEVLAVGDIAFQVKCFDRIAELRESGTTIVIVTHNLNAVRRLCDRTLVIHDGEQRYDGPTVDALSRYHELLGEPREGQVGRFGEPTVRRAALFEAVDLVDQTGASTRHVHSGDHLSVTAQVRVLEDITDARLAFRLITERGVLTYARWWPIGYGQAAFKPGEVVTVRIPFDTALATGSYSIQLGLATDQDVRLAPAPQPLMFFATGPRAVRGVTDLRGELHLGRDGGPEQIVDVEIEDDTEKTSGLPPL
jgi:energy-coupling factor transporter ATP-binding protein EcfA2